MEVETIIANARSATGLEDLGDSSQLEGLPVLVKASNEEARLSTRGAAMWEQSITSYLANRMKTVDYAKQHPELLEVPIDKPTFVFGLPRTGTTMTINLLSADPARRCYRRFEALDSMPPAAPDYKSDPRYLAAVAQHEALPAHLRAMHLYDVDATIEDSHVLGMAFHGQQYTLPVYGYHAWWRASDCTDTFAYHRRVITLLQSRRPPDLWLFKAPHHKFHLESIVAAYPDVRFLMTHRDPTKVVPSYASLVSALFPAAEHHHDMARLGAELTVHLRDGMANAMAARARLGEDRFIDVHHRDLNRDPIGTLHRVYDGLGLTLSPEYEARVREWVAVNRTGAHGTHRYTAEQFGLTTARLRDEFAFYIDHFDIDVEG